MSYLDELRQKSSYARLMSGGLKEILDYMASGAWLNMPVAINMSSLDFQKLSDPRFQDVLYSEIEMNRTSRNFADYLFDRARRPPNLHLIADEIVKDSDTLDGADPDGDGHMGCLAYLMPNAFIQIRHQVPEYCDESRDSTTHIDVYVSHDIEMLYRYADGLTYGDKTRLEAAMKTIRESLTPLDEKTPRKKLVRR